jgi:hypothetical protein
MLRHSPCNDTPHAATVAVTACGVSLLSYKKILFFVSILHIAVHGHSETLPVVTATVPAFVATYQITELASYLLDNI